MPLAYALWGKEVEIRGVYRREADAANLELATRWRREVQTLLDDGQLRCHPPREISGKWDGIIEGLEILKHEPIRGQEVVVRIGSAS